jgi:acetyl-CoA carboxylase biotin carboxyl carrier protein
LNLKELKEILQLLDEKEIAEFELEEEGIKLRIRKGAASANHSGPPPVTASPVPVDLPNAAVQNPVPAAAPAASAPLPLPAPATAPAEAPDAGLFLVKSPIVGTFFRAADPNSPTFVNVGDRVRVGQVLCIIEAMKLMNEIEAEVAGVITKIHHENGQPVQYGEPLFAIQQER